MTAISSGTPLISLDAIVLDTETTGLDPQSARIVQIGAVRIERGALSATGAFDQLVNPQCPIPPASSAIHHVTDADVGAAPTFAALSRRFEDYRGDAIVIGHNISFDIAVLAAEYRRIDRTWQPPRTLDTLVLARAANPGLANYSLEALSVWLGTESGARHTALGDAETTARIFLALTAKLQARGVRTFGEAENLGRATAEDMLARNEPGVYPPGEALQTPPRRDAAARVDAYPYSHRVGDVMSGAPMIVTPNTTITEVARLIGEKSVSSAFVGADARDRRLGIVTERDLMRALASSDGAGAAPVATIMSRPLVTVARDAFVYRALALMDRHRIRHLGVSDASGALVGALTTGDLLRQRAQAALFMGDEIDHAEDVAALAAIWSRLPAIAASMLGEGVDSADITAVIAEELCAMTRRAGELAAGQMRDAGHGEAPAPYCLLVLGSGGRGESRLSPDQDNALIHGGAEDDAGPDSWFAEFGERLARILDDAGIPYCKGGIMARSPAWRHSLKGWKQRVLDWTTRFEGSSLLTVDIFFDYRPVLGDRALADELWAFAHNEARKSAGFLKSLARLTTDVRSPIGFFGSISTTDGRVDLKMNGLFAIVGGARALAIRHDVRERATTKRLEGVRQTGLVNTEEIDNLIAAHEILSREILRQQIEDVGAGIAPSTRVRLDRLTRHERADLKWALRQVDLARLMVGGPGGLA